MLSAEYKYESVHGVFMESHPETGSSAMAGFMILTPSISHGLTIDEKSKKTCDSFKKLNSARMPVMSDKLLFTAYAFPLQ